MDEDVCDINRIWNNLPDVTLDDGVISIYYWYFIQLG